MTDVNRRLIVGFSTRSTTGTIHSDVSSFTAWRTSKTSLDTSIPATVSCASESYITLVGLSAAHLTRPESLPPNWSINFSPSANSRLTNSWAGTGAISVKKTTSELQTPKGGSTLVMARFASQLQMAHSHSSLRA